MKEIISVTVVALALSAPTAAVAAEVTLIAPGGMRCAIDRITPEFERRTGHTIKATIGSGGGTHQQVVRGEVFDVPIVQPPYQDVLTSGHVVASSETPLATVPLVVVVRKGTSKPDISTADAVKRMLLGAKSLSYPDGAGGRGGAAGVSFDLTQRQLGIYDQIQPKVRRVQGVSLMKLLTNGDIDVAVTFSSEIDDPGVEVIGPLPRAISMPTALVGFVSTHAKAPDAAKALLTYLSSVDAAAAYQACGMQSGR
jgi:molybdate transport system substrate-binding protein